MSNEILKQSTKEPTKVSTKTATKHGNEPACGVATGQETCHARLMRPADIQQIGEELAIKWEDGSESFIALEKLRKCCPCAGCKGEKDIMGNLYKNPERPLSAQAFKLVRFERVGGYAIQPVWGDGHATGLYSFDYLKRVEGAEGM